MGRAEAIASEGHKEARAAASDAEQGARCVGSDACGEVGGGVGGSGGGSKVDEGLLQSALAKTGRNLLPLCFAIALLNYIDRSNLAYAALSFNRDQGFDARVYSVGVSLFSVALCCCQVPSNLIMVRVGFRPWLSFLLVAWGCVAVSFMFISSPWSFYLCRLLLGVFESGAFPAMWYALSVFFPRARVTRPYAYLTMAILASNLIGAPLAAAFILLDGKGALKGWQWLFLLEGLPSILLGVVVFWRLPSSVKTAHFLTPPEREALAAEVARDHLDDPAPRDFKASLSLLRMALHNRYLYPLFVAGLMASIAAASFIAYTPIIINSLLEGTTLGKINVAASHGGSSTWKPVLLSMVPYAVGVVLTFIVAHLSQSFHEHFYPIIACMAGSGVLIALFVPLARAHPAAGFAALAGSLAGNFAGQGPGLALVARLSWGRESFVAQPLVNTFNLIGAILGPLIVGALLSTSAGFTYVSVLMGIVLCATALLLLATRIWVMRDGGLPEGGTGPRSRPPVMVSLSGIAASCRGGNGSSLSAKEHGGPRDGSSSNAM